MNYFVIIAVLLFAGICCGYCIAKLFIWAAESLTHIIKGKHTPEHTLGALVFDYIKSLNMMEKFTGLEAGISRARKLVVNDRFDFEIKVTALSKEKSDYEKVPHE